jgi:hypothetical protein
MVDLHSHLESAGAGRVESSIIRVPSEGSHEVLLKSSGDFQKSALTECSPPSLLLVSMKG